ncbi:hypothetical protein H2204_000699 [Knufia peltigerae]|uniref:Uncharacterized protein n=1 Tax=Knufia peltigerae TaxID=1002370 RepID=A0AA39D3X2_9EURO|nr:hypothetical protein H2204_000699 [Knufia peltigerae]
MNLVIWGSSPRSLTAIRYRMTIERTPLTSTDLSTDVLLADILTQFEAVMYDEMDIELIFNQLRDPVFPREDWLDSIDELVEEVIQDVRIRKGIAGEHDDDDDDDDDES